MLKGPVRKSLCAGNTTVPPPVALAAAASAACTAVVSDVRPSPLAPKWVTSKTRSLAAVFAAGAPADAALTAAPGRSAGCRLPPAAADASAGEEDEEEASSASSLSPGRSSRRCRRGGCSACTIRSSAVDVGSSESASACSRARRARTAAVQHAVCTAVCMRAHLHHHGQLLLLHAHDPVGSNF